MILSFVFRISCGLFFLVLFKKFLVDNIPSLTGAIFHPNCFPGNPFSLQEPVCRSDKLKSRFREQSAQGMTADMKKYSYGTAGFRMK